MSFKGASSSSIMEDEVNSSTAGDPLEAPPSRWKVAKRNARLTFLSAISKLYGGSMSKSRHVPGQEPQVTVGPVIGKVTCTTARVLIEVDMTGSLTLELHECHASLEKQPSFLRRQFTAGRSKSLKQKQTPRRGTVKKIKKSVQAFRPSVFMFEGLIPGTKYTVEVKGCKGSILGTELLVGSFCTFPEVPAETLTVGVTSCNKIFITELIASQWDLWAHLSKSIEAGKIDLLVHLGDQIYGDGDKRQDAEAGLDKDKWSDRFRLGKDKLRGVPPEEWINHQESICERYREVYRDTWAHPPTAKCLASCPNLMIYDDHEVRDNWGDLTSDWDSSTPDFFVARCAWLVSMEYQRQLYEDVDFTQVEKIHQDYHFHMVGGVGLMFLDIRGSRTFHRVKDDERKYLGTHQWTSITKALDGDGIFSEARALLVCSPAPLVFLEPRITQSAAAAIPRLEDFKGHWSYKEHVKEQLLFIESLTKWKSSRSGRDVLVLGGDVHCGGHSEIIKNNKVLFRQLTTSAIANMPLPKSAYYFMRAAGRLGRLQHEYCFRHHQWTRARNYGVVQIKHHSLEPGAFLSFGKLFLEKFLLSPTSVVLPVLLTHKDHDDETVEHKEVEISAQLVKCKFMGLPAYTEKVYNIDSKRSNWYTCFKA